jgi:ketosteroid isomerase-like protein
MSDANVENLRAMLAMYSTQTIHALLEAWRRGEVDPALLDLMDPEVTYEDYDLPDHAGEVFHGPAGVVEATESWAEPYKEMTNELQRIVGSGDCLVAIHRFRARARRTGIEFDQPSAYVYTFRDGKIIRIQGFWDPAEALAAAGLEESAMSENLDLVRSIYAEWERGDHSSAEWADPQIEFTFADGPEPGTWRGIVGMAEAFGGWLRTWEDVHFEAEQYRELDDGRVLVLVHITGGRGKTSGLDLREVRTEGATLFDIRGGKVTRLVLYYQGDGALADLGLAS